MVTWNWKFVIPEDVALEATARLNAIGFTCPGDRFTPLMFQVRLMYDGQLDGFQALVVIERVIGAVPVALTNPTNWFEEGASTIPQGMLFRTLVHKESW